jgi:GT2 family glycosyltransferase
MARPSNNYRDLEHRLAQPELCEDMSVSVVVPFYKGHYELARCLAGLSRQNYPAFMFEVVITVDGTDPAEPKEMCKALLPEAVRYRVVAQPRQGYRLATARNNGIRVAEGDLIILLDFDIVTESDFIRQHVRWHRTGEPIITFGLREFRDLSDVSVEEVAKGMVDLASLPAIPSISNRLREIDSRVRELEWIHEHPAPYNLGHGFNLGFRKAHALDAGLFDEAFNGASNYEDIEFCFRMWSLIGCLIIYAPQCKVFHQENDVVTSEERDAGMEVNRRKLYALVPELAEYRRAFRIGEWSENTVACLSLTE